MPELPEVETVKNVTAPQIRGRRIEKVALERRDVIAHPVPDDFVRLVTGRAVTGMRSEERRVGKECRSRWSPYH